MISTVTNRNEFKFIQEIYVCSQKQRYEVNKEIQLFILKLSLYVVQACSLLGSILMSWAHLHCRQYTAALPQIGAAAVQVSLIF